MDIFNFQLSLEKLRKMDGKRVYVFSKRSWATISMEGSYPLLVLEGGECISWEDWPDVQIGGIYTRSPVISLDYEFYKHAEKVYFGYRYASFFERLICTFWYLTCQRWHWIFYGRNTTHRKEKIHARWIRKAGS